MKYKIELDKEPGMIKISPATGYNRNCSVYATPEQWKEELAAKDNHQLAQRWGESLEQIVAFTLFWRL